MVNQDILRLKVMKTFDGLSLDGGESMPAIEFIEKLKTAIESFPVEFRNEVLIKVHGPDDVLTWIDVAGPRLETEEEARRRVEIEEQFLARREQEDRRRLRELMWKYPDEKR